MISASWLNKVKKSGKIIVLVTGVFDVIHQEHLTFLKKAKQSGDFLLVGVETDGRVAQMKGSNRPINPQEKRVRVMGSIDVVDAAFLLPSQFDKPEDHRKLMGRIRPDILAISSHTKFQKAKKTIVKQFGGELKIVHTHNPNTSTTKIINGNK